MTTIEEDLATGPDIYYALTAHTTDLVTILEADGTIRYASPSHRRLLGYAPAALQGTNAFALVHPEDVAGARATFTAAAQADDGTPVRVQCRYRHADGSWRIIATTGSSHLADPLVRGFIATSQDVTQRVRAEEQLREKEAQYRSIFEATGDGMVIVDPDEGRYVEANPAFCTLFGYTYDEVIGLPAVAVVHPDRRPYIAAAIQEIAAGGAAPSLFRGPHKDGSTLLLESHGTIFTYRGKTHILGVMRDVTARLQAEEQLREKEAQYRSVFDASTDGLSIVDMDGYIVEANPAYCTLYGYQHDEVIGLHASALVRPEDHHLLAKALQTVADAGTFDIQGVGVREDGSFLHVEAHVTTFTYRGTPHLLGVVRDVGERVRSQELLEQRVAERTRELTTLLDVSHSLASTLELQPLLGLILDQLRTVAEYIRTSIFTVESEAYVMVATRGPEADEHLRQRRFPLSRGPLIWEMIGRGEPIVIDDVRGDTPVARAYRATVDDLLETTFANVCSWMAVPLMLRERVIGMLTMSSSAPHTYTQHHVTLARAIANQAAVAIENARLYEQAQHVAAMEERQRLARELHDSVSQALYGIGLGARTARTLLDRDPAQVAEPLDYVLALAETGLAEMRALIFELLPEALEKGGLVAALDKQVASLRARYQIAIAATLDAEPEALLAVKEALYRIAQEALHNAVKHAQARSIEVRLEASPERLALEVRDDGIGFETGGTFPGHLGLRTMRERATRVGATLEVESAPGAGTRVRVQLPYRG